MIGLVLEGGGMRAAYTAGVLDTLMDYGVKFPYIVGTSAGATTGINYISGQRGRSRFINVDLHTSHPYVGLSSFLAGRGVIDMTFLFDYMPANIYPFDVDSFFGSGVRFVAVATDAITGKAVYMEEYSDTQRIVDVCRASCSLPILCPMALVDGRPMVDGGVGDSIPFEKALADGCEKIVVVLTKEIGYRKSEKRMWLPNQIYKEYPHLREALQTRGARYNAQLEALEKLEAEGKALIIRPKESCGVGRTTTDVEKLERLYEHGLEDGMRIVRELPRMQVSR